MFRGAREVRLEEAVKADMSKVIHDQLVDIVNKAYRIGYDTAKSELVHCKDCKHYIGRWCTKFSTKQFDLNDIYKGVNDFCSQAERKE